MWIFVNNQRSFFITHNGMKLTFPPNSFRAVEHQPKKITVYNHSVNFVLYVKDGKVYAWFLEARTRCLLEHIPPPLRHRLLGE